MDIDLLSQVYVSGSLWKNSSTAFMLAFTLSIEKVYNQKRDLYPRILKMYVKYSAKNENIDFDREIIIEKNSLTSI